MIKRIKIEKRLPFGFRGDWASVYKKYPDFMKVEDENGDIVVYKKNYYVDVGVGVQIKRVGDEKRVRNLFITNGISEIKDLVLETTDAVWDDKTNYYSCVISNGDIVKAFNCFWLVEGVVTKSIYSPTRNDFYYLNLKNINGEEILNASN